jgi:16S rRNA (adenine1518-N6/adenine1519-N6)-dimethyltransferase
MPASERQQAASLRIRRQKPKKGPTLKYPKKEKKEKFNYKKRLGQNFLHQKNKVLEIIEKIAPLPDETYIEIGAGSGFLTGELVDKVKKLHAIEIDREAFEVLKAKFADKQNLDLINADIMQSDLKAIAGEHAGKIKVVGNIPYYITTPIIEKLINGRDFISRAYLMVQKEVADRITAKEGSKTYGSLSIFCQYYADCKVLLRIDRGNFVPVPDVDSAFIELNFEKKEPIPVKNEEFFFKITRGAFTQRRKMLMNNLKRVLELDEETLKKAFDTAGIDLKTRAEAVSILGFAKLADLLYNQTNK